LQPAVIENQWDQISVVLPCCAIEDRLAFDNVWPALLSECFRHDDYAVPRSLGKNSTKYGNKVPSHKLFSEELVVKDQVPTVNQLRRKADDVVSVFTGK